MGDGLPCHEENQRLAKLIIYPRKHQHDDISLTFLTLLLQMDSRSLHPVEIFATAE